jgi:hypothetical protein
LTPKGTSAFSTSLDITCARLGAITTVAILAESDPGVAATAVAILCGIALVCVRVVARATRSTE